VVVRAGTREYRLADRRIWLGSDGVFGGAALIRIAPSVSVEALLPKRRLKRAEMRLEVAPLIEACAEDGQADLFRTRCADGALGPIKLDTRGFKLEAAEIQYPADVTLQVPYYFLMLRVGPCRGVRRPSAA